MSSGARPGLSDHGGDNARRVTERGAGIALAGGADALPRVAGAVTRVLGDPRHRAAAAAIAAEIRALPPIDDAVEVLGRAEALRAHP